MKLLFRPDGTDNIDPNVDAAEVANGANALGKTWANTLANEVPPTEVPQEDTVTATEKRQSSLLLTQAARHIEEVARHMEAIDQVRSKHYARLSSEGASLIPSMYLYLFCERLHLTRQVPMPGM